MLIKIPPYNNLDTDYWVLYTLMKSSIPKGIGKPRLAIINNYLLYKKQIEEIIIKIKNSFSENSKWHWIQKIKFKLS